MYEELGTLGGSRQVQRIKLPKTPVFQALPLGNEYRVPELHCVGKPTLYGWRGSAALNPKRTFTCLLAAAAGLRVTIQRIPTRSALLPFSSIRSVFISWIVIALRALPVFHQITYIGWSKFIGFVVDIQHEY
jgi:hypothetical protein